MSRLSVVRWAAFLGLVAAAAASPSKALAQAGGNTASNGVIVDVDGVLRNQVFADPNGQLMRQRVMAARAQLDPKVAKASKLRKVSLNRLEQAIAARIDQNTPPTDEMKNLAGLTRVRYVFYYPETKDIVLAGPAEAWGTDLSGRMRGLDSGRPCLELQDLIVALRAFPPGGKKGPVMRVSIDPTPEGLARMQAFLNQIGAHATPAQTDMIVQGLRTSLGMQNIVVGGMSPNTHFAQVLIEADYRMKLIGIGLEKPPLKLASYVDRASPASANRSALQRWFFLPDYKCAHVTADNMGMELVGDVVNLVAEDQLVGSDGSRAVTGRSNKASEQFVAGFTAKYTELSSKVPVYAQLRNCIDLAISAAWIQQNDFYGKAGWTAPVLSNEKAVPVETYNTPVTVETCVASVWKGNHLMTPVGGGVHVQPKQALLSSNIQPDADGKIAEQRTEISLKDLAAGQWWWD